MDKKLDYETIYSLDVPNEPTSTSTLPTDVTSTLPMSSRNSNPQKPKTLSKIKTQETIYSLDVPNEQTSNLLNTLSVLSENSNAKNPTNSSKNATKTQECWADSLQIEDASRIGSPRRSKRNINKKIDYNELKREPNPDINEEAWALEERKVQAPKNSSSSQSRKSSQKKWTASNTPTTPVCGTTVHPASKAIPPAVYTFTTDSSITYLDSPGACGITPRIDPPSSNYENLHATSDLCALLDEDDFDMLDDGDFILGMKLHCLSLDRNCGCEECKLFQKNPYLKEDD